MKDNYKQDYKSSKMKTYYWHRTKENLNLNIVEYVKNIDNDRFLVVTEYKKEKLVYKKDLIKFDPDSLLFRELMKIASYRNDSYIKKILVSMHLKPDEYMKLKQNVVNRYDADIPENVFYAEYRLFYESDKKFCDDSMLNLENVIVTGTSNMNVWMLYRIISGNGGMEKVTEDQKWKSLFYSMMSKTNVSYTIRTFYKKNLYEFEFYRRYKDDGDSVNKYVFAKGQNIYFLINEDKYYGTVKLRRNKGINQYYVQFFNWSKENSEWFSEDILEPYGEKFDYTNNVKRKTRSSKANNLIDDPLTREKHSHFSNKNLKKIGMYKFKGNNYNLAKNNEMENMKPRLNSSLLELQNTNVNIKGLNSRDNDYVERFKGLMNNSGNYETINKSGDNKIDKKFIKEGCEMPKKQEKTKNKRKFITTNEKSKKMQDIEDFMIKMGIMDKDCKLSGDNWPFMQFFGYK